VSAFCEATIQIPPFIGYGAAGTGIVVLEPLHAMTANQLAYVAAYINLAMRWRFSWYWRTTATRLGRLLIPENIPDDIAFDVHKLMPKITALHENVTRSKLALKRFALAEIFDLKAGDYHHLGGLSRGTVPVISCGDEENGLCGYFDVEHVYSHKMTIAFNGATLTAKYHPYEFAAKDDIAVCIPKTPLQLTTLLFIQVILRREKWRFSYYRKCFKEKLERVTIPLPALHGAIDESAIQDVMKSTRYWEYLSERLHH
jgi:hypothetical protein